MVKLIHFSEMAMEKNGKMTFEEGIIKLKSLTSVTISLGYKRLIMIKINKG